MRALACTWFGVQSFGRVLQFFCNDLADVYCRWWNRCCRHHAQTVEAHVAQGLAPLRGLVCTFITTALSMSCN